MTAGPLAAMPKELQIPPAAEADDDSFELLRVWAANEEQHVVIHSGLEGGPSAFGYMIANYSITARCYMQNEKVVRWPKFWRRYVIASRRSGRVLLVIQPGKSESSNRPLTRPFHRTRARCTITHEIQRFWCVPAPVNGDRYATLG